MSHADLGDFFPRPSMSSWQKMWRNIDSMVEEEGAEEGKVLERAWNLGFCLKKGFRSRGNEDRHR